jgi:mannose-6-phosphate isomerase-like protein (cupin superfamily)
MKIRNDRLAIALLALPLLAATGGSVRAAEPPALPDLKTFASSAEVSELIAKGRDQRKPGQTVVVVPVLSLAPYKANIEVRTGPAAAMSHDTEAELFYCVAGGGTFISGGTIIAPKAANGNVAGTGIEGGTARAVSQGDIWIVPENTPHQSYPDGNGLLVLLSMHVPRPVPVAQH